MTPLEVSLWLSTEEKSNKEGDQKKCSSRGDNHQGNRSLVGVVTVAQRKSLRGLIDLNASLD